MSTPLSSSRIERFSKGDRFAVSPEEVERELSSLWREAGESNAGGQPVTRACLWNIVAHAEERPDLEGAIHAQLLIETLKELPRYLASRTLVLRTHPERSNGPDLESWISANCVVSPEGGKFVCSEEITIQSYGRGEEHMPALVRALLVPDIPTAMVFAGGPPMDRPISKGLLRSADRIVTRLDASNEPGVALRRVLETGFRAPLGAMDLGWVKQAVLRWLIGDLFEPPTSGDAADEISEVTVTHRPDADASGRLMLGWIASVLRAKEPSSTGARTWRATRANGKRLSLSLHEDASAPLAVSAVSLVAAGQEYGLKVSADGIAQLACSAGSPRQVHLDKIERARELSRALRTRSHDRSFEKALAVAARL